MSEYENNKKKNSFGYEDLKNSIEVEIFGLRFDINVDEIEELANNGSENLSFNEQLNKILGNGALDKINKKRISDGYDELNSYGVTKVYGFIMEQYTNMLTGNIVNPVVDVLDNHSKKVYDFTNMNRSQRRYNNRYNNRHRRY